MRIHLRRTAPLLFAAAVMLSSASATAATIYYGDLLTSSKFTLLSDRHATASLATDFKNFSVDPSWTLGPSGSGLGNALVPATGTSGKKYTHSFAAPAGATIEKAWLFVSFSDDGFDSAAETAVVDISGSIYKTKGVLGYLMPSPIVEVVSADVTAQIVQNGGNVDVVVSPSKTGQDFYIHASLLKVQYSTGSTGRTTSAVPEPGAFLVFAVGLAVTAAGLRSRSAPQAV